VKLESQLVLTPRFLHLVPFLGVVLLLLTFFLLGSSMLMQSGIRVRPPPSNSMLEPMPRSLVVTLSAGREPQIYLDDKPLTLTQLTLALEQKRSQGRQLLIRADELSAFGAVTSVTQIALDKGYEVVHATTPASNEHSQPSHERAPR